MTRSAVHYRLKGEWVTIRSFADRLGLTLQGGYYWMHRCGGDMEKAWRMADHYRKRRAERRALKIMTEGEDVHVRNTDAAAAGRDAGRAADL